MRLHAGMLESFCAEAVSHASYLMNMSPSTTVGLQIPEEIWYGESVDYSTYGYSVVQYTVWLIVLKGTS